MSIFIRNKANVGEGWEQLSMKSIAQDRFTKLTKQARLRLLKMHYESNVGHIGGNLSCLDILMVLFHRMIKQEDVFVLSKGHAAGALYTVLWTIGQISDEELMQFHQDGTKLSGHPVPDWIPEIKFATGSLGHGLPLSAGVALGKKLKTEVGNIFCLMSDGEWNAGSNWEALVFAIHHRLDNLRIIIDVNGLQGFGTTSEVADLEPLTEKFCAFGAEVIEVDGHNHEALEKALLTKGLAPIIIVARTKKGNGVSFMENKLEWHYLPLTKEQYEQAVAEVGAK